MFRIVAEEIVKADGTPHKTFPLQVSQANEWIALLNAMPEEWEVYWIGSGPEHKMTIHEARIAINLHVWVTCALMRAERKGRC